MTEDSWFKRSKFIDPTKIPVKPPPVSEKMGTAIIARLTPENVE